MLQFIVLTHPAGDRKVPGIIGTNVLAEIPSFQHSLKLKPAFDVSEPVIEDIAVWVVGDNKKSVCASTFHGSIIGER